MHPVAWHQGDATRTSATSLDGGSQGDFQAIRRRNGAEKAVSGTQAALFAVCEDHTGDIGRERIQLAT